MQPQFPQDAADTRPEAEPAEPAGLAGLAGLAELAALAERIEQEHLTRLREDLPRLEALAGEVAGAHGGSDPRLAEVRSRVRELASEFLGHVEKGQRTLFPALRELASPRASGADRGPLGFALAVLRGDHEAVSEILAAIRTLTDGFTPPDRASASHVALLRGLGGLEADLARLIRTEEEVLFPRAQVPAGGARRP